MSGKAYEKARKYHLKSHRFENDELTTEAQKEIDRAKTKHRSRNCLI